MQKGSRTNSLLLHSIGILNSIWLVVFVTYFFEAIISPWAMFLLGPAALTIILPLKIYLYSGIYGNLIEIASGEEIFFSFDSFRRNAHRLWKYYAVLTVFSFAVEFFLTSVLPPDRPMAATIFSRHINIILLYVIAWLMVSDKYAEAGPSAKVKIDGQSAGAIFILYAFEMLLFYQPYFFPISQESLTNIFILTAKYLHLLEFLVLSLLVLRQYPQIKEQFTSGKELYLIFPPLNGREGPFGDLVSRFVVSQQPPMFVVLKALTPKNYRIRKFNKVIWHDRYYASNKLVAIGCFSSNCAEAYRIAKEFKKRGSTVIMGGPHVSYLPEEALEFCDSVAIGEVEGIWEQIIKDHETGSLRKTYSGGRTEDCHHLVYEELLKSPPNVIKDFLETSRGCKFKCHFCMIPSINEGKARNNPTFELVELIKKVAPRYRRLQFIDNNIYNDPAYARELFKALKPLNIKWFSPCTIDIAKNEETLKLAKESGCDTLLFGYEIPEEGPGKEQGGKLTMANKYVEYTRKVQNAGIKIKATFTIGWESQNFQAMKQLYRFCRELKPFITIPFLLTPFPGTSFFDEMIQENRIVNLNWKKFNQWHTVIKNSKLNNMMLERSFIFIAVFSYFFLSDFGRKIMAGFLFCLITLPLLAVLLVWQKHLLGI